METIIGGIVAVLVIEAVASPIQGIVVAIILAWRCGDKRTRVVPSVHIPKNEDK